jgi:MYXO-CTERM domain-containing protein
MPLCDGAPPPPSDAGPSASDGGAVAIDGGATLPDGAIAEGGAANDEAAIDSSSGCSCRTSSTRRSESAFALFVGLALVLARRRESVSKGRAKE